MTGRLQDQVCLITGAAQGIGAAYARACAGEGASVAIVDLHRIDQAAEVEHDIAAMGQRSIALRADVTDAEAMLEVGRRVVEEFGRIDCLVNNAGLMFDQLTATWDDFLAVNLPILTKLPADAPAPRIVPEGYGMTKWMLIRQTRTMAQTLGNRGIRVNAVCPGVTMPPAAKAVVPDVIVQQLVDASLLGSTLEPDDMAGLIVYLASNESSKMTGQVLINDAGTWFGG